ncbi:hypothetical protein TNCV_1764831 [Trichonephila clavipes]|nr:hypothetical protein TNCV_1764831 [Trichonephila clavipes]
MRFEITTFEWKSNALPTALQGHMDYLHSGCDVKSIYTFANRVEMFKRNNIPTSLVGFEPTTFGLEVQRAIHCATGTLD